MLSAVSNRSCYPGGFVKLQSHDSFDFVRNLTCTKTKSTIITTIIIRKRKKEFVVSVTQYKTPDIK